MRIVSFNVNGVRARPHQLARLVEVYSPDIVGLQETKVQDDDFPVQIFDDLGYQINFFGQKGHYGVALMSRKSPQSVVTGFPDDDGDAQKRMICGRYKLSDGKTLAVLNGYFPQGENRSHDVKFPAKRKFYADLNRYLQTAFDDVDYLTVIGDMNIAPVDHDIGIGADNAKRWLKTGKTSFLPEEREWLSTLQANGLKDCFRQMYPDAADRFSWFDYRSRGFERDPKRGLRIDLLLANSALAEHCSDSEIAYDIRAMEKPSDHCPVWADFDLELE